MKAEAINELIDSIKDEVIQWRRHLHQYPELSYHEEKTSQFVFDTLCSFGNLVVSRPTPTSVLARLTGKEPGKVIMIRADMDALPIQEENNFDFVSRNPGVMHACGHDVHMAMVLGTAKILSAFQDNIKGEVRFLFQHAEEMFPPGGAAELVKAGVLNGVDVIIGGHIWVPMESGKVGIAYGPLMASTDMFRIVVKGKGGHGAMPHLTVDAIVIGAQIVSNLQHIVSRNIDPLDSVVVSIGRFIGGTKDNIIPGSVQIDGTFRTLDPQTREKVPRLIERIVKGITEAHGANYEFDLIKGFRPLVNNKEIVRILKEAACEVLGEQTVEIMRPSMGGEDFSAYLQQVPGAFFFLGGGNQEKGYIYPNHHPHFAIDEAAVINGIKVFVKTADKLLNQ